MSARDAYRIVLGYDFSDTAKLALEQAVQIAARNLPAELHLATVIDSDHAELIPPPQRHGSLVQIADDLRERLIAVGRNARTELDRLQPGAPVPVTAHVRLGRIAEQIATLAAEIEAHVAIVGTHGRRGLSRALVGSVAEKTVRLSPCPVLVVRPRHFELPASPALEPPCPACVAAREATQGASWWCTEHTQAPDGVHIYSRSHRLDHVPPVAGTFRLG